MASLIPGNWKINGNGFDGILAINNIDSNGTLVSCTVYSDPVVGLWDEASRKIVFMRLLNQSDPSTFQIYTGYLMIDNKILAGSFQGFKGTGATAVQSTFGWFAKAP
jgi:hypothetical protein